MSENKENETSVGKAAVYYFVCQVLLRGMGFLTTPLFTRMMSKAEYGTVANFFSWETILYPILSLNLVSSIGKARFDYENNNDSFIFSILVACSGACATGGVVFYLFRERFEDLFSMSITHILILCVYIVFLAAFNFHQTQQNVFHQYKSYTAFALVLALVRIILSVIFVIASDSKADARIIGYVMPAVVLGIYIYYRLWRAGKHTSIEQVAYALRISLPLLLTSISSSLLGVSDRIMITKYCGEEQTAMYSVAYSISSIAGIFWVALNSAWAPWLRDNLHLHNIQVIKNKSKIFSYIYSFLVICLMLVSPEIIIIMGGKQYSEAMWAMPAVILSMTMSFFYNFYYEVCYYYGETILISMGTVIACVVNILLNILFVPRYGYIAASYTSYAGMVVLMVAYYLVTKFKIKNTSMYDNRFIFFNVFVLAVIQFGCALIYRQRAVRYLVLIMFVIFSSKEVFKLMKQSGVLTAFSIKRRG